MNICTTGGVPTWGATVPCCCCACKGRVLQPARAVPEEHLQVGFLSLLCVQGKVLLSFTTLRASLFSEAVEAYATG